MSEAVPQNPVQTGVPSHRFIKVLDVAEITGLPVSTVYELTRQGRIGGVVRIGRHIRFDRSALERWLEAGGERNM